MEEIAEGKGKIFRVCFLDGKFGAGLQGLLSMCTDRGVFKHKFHLSDLVVGGWLNNPCNIADNDLQIPDLVQKLCPSELLSPFLQPNHNPDNIQADLDIFGTGNVPGPSVPSLQQSAPQLRKCLLLDLPVFRILRNYPDS